MDKNKAIIYCMKIWLNASTITTFYSALNSLLLSIITAQISTAIHPFIYVCKKIFLVEPQKPLHHYFLKQHIWQIKSTNWLIENITTIYLSSGDNFSFYLPFSYWQLGENQLTSVKKTVINSVRFPLSNKSGNVSEILYCGQESRIKGPLRGYISWKDTNPLSLFQWRSGESPVDFTTLFWLTFFVYDVYVNRF